MLVVDTSVAVKWVVREDGSNIEHGTQAALDLLERGLVAPDCMLAEFANAIYKKVKRGEIGSTQAIASLEVLPDILKFYPTVSEVPEGLRIAIKLSHPVHDCLFLVLALRLGCPLVTADRKFFDQISRMKVDHPVYMLGDTIP